MKKRALIHIFHCVCTISSTALTTWSHIFSLFPPFPATSSIWSINVADRHKIFDVRVEVLTAVTMKSNAHWVVIHCFIQDRKYKNLYPEDGGSSYSETSVKFLQSPHKKVLFEVSSVLGMSRKWEFAVLNLYHVCKRCSLCI
jgi:hypothetical protein